MEDVIQTKVKFHDKKEVSKIEFLKGLSFNVTLSEEQMEHIASLAADKVQYTFQRIKNNDLWNEDKIKNLERDIAQRDKLMVEKEFYIARIRNTMDMYKKKLDELNPDNR